MKRRVFRRAALATVRAAVWMGPWEAWTGRGWVSTLPHVDWVSDRLGAMDAERERLLSR